ncbi:sigma-54 interaction domain-containing protein [Massilia glaciei]|uniref:Sigma-54-dependent Fis family transcriptional regulator n=1 Tax=Massilia glaciei TaxID=1524097 RepID=A0A2U2I4R0_9BURK|nr:sigma 54-interacting transcriptional regulator [Massilia glaciei]PWF54629.1 sigma-54-dependent Fis family transcriptional regulator [Massilia glaciei]
MSNHITEAFLKDSDAIHKHAMASLFAQLDSLCEGAITVDRHGRIAWINDKYLAMLGLGDARQALGRDVEELIPNSLMREVMRSNLPILLDIMSFGKQSMVVTRMPLHDDAGEVVGAIGFVLYEKMNYLKPLLAKFAALQAELALARRGLAESRRPKHTLDSYIGGGPASAEVKRLAGRAGRQDASVLLLGETGTGKEIVASAIHAASPRAALPFIGINMAAVPEALLEAEFFGVAPGAFTGADKRAREGKFKLADGGTLFLDEIGDLPLAMQGKLLRVLQEQEFELLGSNSVVRVDVRVIAATSVDLGRLMREGRFRSDLYYRLNVLQITLPPLRERLEDMPALCDALLEQISQRTGMALRTVGAGAMALLAACRWPGNVRELANALERACILSDNLALGAADFAFLGPPPASAKLQYADALAAFDRAIIGAALQDNAGKVPAAARQLGMSRATLYKRIAALGMSARAAS